MRVGATAINSLHRWWSQNATFSRGCLVQYWIALVSWTFCLRKITPNLRHIMQEFRPWALRLHSIYFIHLCKHHPRASVHTDSRINVASVDSFVMSSFLYFYVCMCASVGYAVECNNCAIYAASISQMVSLSGASALLQIFSQIILLRLLSIIQNAKITEKLRCA